MKSIAYQVVRGLRYVLSFIIYVYITPAILVAVVVKLLRMWEASLSDTRAERGVSEEKKSYDHGRRTEERW